MITIACPCCRAMNDTSGTCRRCKADLSLLVALEKHRANLLDQAIIAIREGKFFEVSRLLKEAETLRPGPDLIRWRAVGALLERDYKKALQHYHEQCREGDASAGGQGATATHA